LGERLVSTEFAYVGPVLLTVKDKVTGFWGLHSVDLLKSRINNAYYVCWKGRVLPVEDTQQKEQNVRIYQEKN
jgi:hypothetical protein